MDEERQYVHEWRDDNEPTSKPKTDTKPYQSHMTSLCLLGIAGYQLYSADHSDPLVNIVALAITLILAYATWPDA